MPKRGCDVTINEVAKCYKLVAKGYCEPISFTVPRKVCLSEFTFLYFFYIKVLRVTRVVDL